MFDIDVFGPVSGIDELDDAGLIDASVSALRLERAASARRLYALAQLFWRREKQAEFSEREQWRIDGWDAMAAEVAAAAAISRHKAARQIQVAVCIWENLPKLAAVFLAGWVDYAILDRIESRVSLIKPEDRARIDEILARRVKRWHRLSRRKLLEQIDFWVAHVDVLAKRPTRDRDEGRHIGVGPDQDGVVEIWGLVRTATGAALDARLDALAATVCPADPRTKDQRRSDAADAMAVGAERMTCECGQADCPAADAIASPVVVHVVADAATVAGKSAIPGYVPGYGTLPAELVRLYVRTAKLQQVRLPSEMLDPEPGYRPSTALATYVKLRDLTCRFPGCDAPAQVCDIDHSVPWPDGPTHPSNLKLLCRHHHLLKTFYTGPGGWSETQKPDGTIVWTSPSGHEYTTKPAGALFFPQFAAPTAKLALPRGYRPTSPGRHLMMPTRARTRTAERQARIAYERGLNYKRLYREADPPPF